MRWIDSPRPRAGSLHEKTDTSAHFTGKDAMKRLKLWGAMIVLIVVVTLALSEIMLRLAGFNHARFYTRDPVMGSWHNPLAEGWWRIENRVWVRINSDGMRDVEHAVAKPPGVYRIAVLGDSQAESMQVPFENTWWHILETELNRCGAFAPAKVEVLNFGVSGFGTAQELLALRSRAWKYSPDTVLLGFLTGNDIRNNSKALEPAKERPFYRLEGGKLVLDDSFLQLEDYTRGTSTLAQWRDVATRHSRVAQSFEMLKETYKAVRATPGQPAREIAGVEVGLDTEVYLAPRDPQWSEAWAVTEALLLALRDEVKSKNARLLVATMTNGVQVLPDEKAREAFRVHVGVEDMFYPDRRVASFLESNRVETVMLAPAMLDEARKTGKRYHGFGERAGTGHWNESGHEAGGRLIAQHLCQAKGGAQPAQ